MNTQPETPRKKKAPRGSPRIVRAQQHRQKALELRRAGHTYAAIGEQLGLSKPYAFKLIREGMEEGRQALGETAAQFRAEEVSRLDGLLLTVWHLATGGDLQAVDRVLKIMERRAKLLGLDAPTKVAETDPDGNEAGPRIIELVAPPLDVSQLSSETLCELLEVRERARAMLDSAPDKEARPVAPLRIAGRSSA